MGYRLAAADPAAGTFSLSGAVSNPPHGAVPAPSAALAVPEAGRAGPPKEPPSFVGRGAAIGAGRGPPPAATSLSSDGRLPAGMR